MSSHEENPPQDDSLDALIGAWQAGTIAPSQWATLCRRLRSDRNTRGRFLQHMQLEADLVWKFSDRNRAKAVLAESFPKSDVPASLSELAEGSYSRDPYYQEILGFISGHEANDLLWTQVYPRLRGYIAICTPRLADIDTVVVAVIDEIASGYQSQMGAGQFYELVRDSSRREMRRRLATQKDATLALEELFSASCFGGNEIGDETSASELYERLSEHVPLKMSEEHLQLLCLRYLHELSPGQIADRLSSSTQRVQLDLAKARLAIWKRCCEPQLGGASQPEIEHLLIVSLLIDRRGLSTEAAGKLRAWLASSDRHRRIFNTFAMLHECVYRQLSIDRLLDSLSLSDNKALRRAIGETVKQIELFAEKATPAELAVTPKAVRFGGLLAVAIATAAVVLIGVGLLLQSGGQQPTTKVEVAMSEPASPVPVREKPTPSPLPPIVATLDELLLQRLDAEGGRPVDQEEQVAHQPGASFRQGESFAITRGIAQFSTVNGSVVVLEGPARIVFRGSDDVALSEGKLVGLNSTKTQEVIVRTPSAMVRDLGTEFGVEVEEDGGTFVAVYEGVVEMSGAERGSLPTPLQKGWQSGIGSDQVAIHAAKPLLHDRAFVRPDEVRLRVAIERGSEAARAEVAFYELMRVEGILAYEGFDGLQGAEGRTIGIDPLRVSALQGLSLGPNLSQGSPLSASSKSIVAADGQQCFVYLNTSENSRLARAGLVSPGGMVGDSPGEVWIAWRAKLSGTQAGRADWAGLSLMHGERRQADEPLFVGVPSNQTAYGLQFFEGPNRAIQRQYPLDHDPAAGGVQEIPPNDQTVLWIAQLTMGPAGDEVRLWCNVPADRVEKTPPHLSQSVEDLRFDRFRLELADSRKQMTCAFDDVLVTTTREALEAALKVVGASR